MVPHIGIVGHGHFGSALSLLLIEQKIPVVTYDRLPCVPGAIAARSVEALVREANLIVLAVPFDDLDAAIADVEPYLDPARHVVIDVTAAKARSSAMFDARLGEDVPWVTTHPLFGAASIATSERPLPVVVCPNEKHRAATDKVISFYRQLDCDVVTMAPSEHDAMIARTQCVAFFVGRAVADAGLTFDPRVTPPLLRGLAKVVDAMRGGGRRALEMMTGEVPDSATVRATLIDHMQRLDRALADPEYRQSVLAPKVMTDQGPNELDVLSPTLKATREAIDQLDAEIVHLLAQRSRLALRARGAKADVGHGVHDLRREAELLAARRAWAVEQKLDADAIEDVFVAILRLSRRVQRS